MVVEAGVVTGYVIAWVMRKARRAGDHLDGAVDAVMDTALDTGLGKLHGVVSAHLGADPALSDLNTEAAAGQVSELTRQRVELSVQAAAGKDEGFAQTLTTLLKQVQSLEQGSGPIAVGQGSVAVAGDVNVRAEKNSAAAWTQTMGNVSFGEHSPDPR